MPHIAQGGHRRGRRRCTSGGTYATGVNYAALPAGAMSVNKNGTTYYLSGNTWFKPAYGASGVYYTAVPSLRPDESEPIHRGAAGGPP